MAAGPLGARSQRKVSRGEPDARAAPLRRATAPQNERRAPRIADLVSFEPDKVEITIDGRKLEPVPGQTVIAHGPDRNLTVDEVGGIRLMERVEG